MDDLIKRLRESRATWRNDGGKVQVCPSDLEAEAAAALSEAQATIARLEDQVGDWIVRADEANVRADRLEAALHDAINAPKGVVPRSAEPFYKAARADLAAKTPATPG